jgi:putative endonuclease
VPSKVVMYPNKSSTCQQFRVELKATGVPDTLRRPSDTTMYYVYILKSRKDNKLYIGRTGDLRRRIAEHADGKNVSTRSRLPLDLIYYEAYASQADSRIRESRLKKSQGARTALRQRLGSSLRQGRSSVTGV